MIGFVLLGLFFDSEDYLLHKESNRGDKKSGSVIILPMLWLNWRNSFAINNSLMNYFMFNVSLFIAKENEARCHSLIGGKKRITFRFGYLRRGTWENIIKGQISSAAVITNLESKIINIYVFFNGWKMSSDGGLYRINLSDVTL